MKINRLAALLAALVLIITVTPTALATTDVVEPSSLIYVSDYADVLSNETKNLIVDQNVKLEQLTGGQVAVVTIDFLNELDSEEYTYALFNTWGVGDETLNNGVVLLLVVSEGKCWMAPGSGIENAFDAGKIETIMNDYFYDDFDAGNYDLAVTNTFNAVCRWYEGYYGVSLSGNTQSAQPNNTYYPEQTQQNNSETGVNFIMLFIFLIVVIIVISALSSRGRRRYDGGYYNGSPRRSGGFWQGMFLGSLFRNNNHHHNNHNNSWGNNRRPPSGGGGFGGGSGGFGGSGRSGGGGGRSGGGGFGGGGSRGGGAGRK